jgi:hypothetical protein
MDKPYIESIGWRTFEEDVDITYIPSNVYLEPYENPSYPKAKWLLRAGVLNLWTCKFEYIAERKEDLLELLKKYIIPLYEQKLQEVKDFCDGKITEFPFHD